MYTSLAKALNEHKVQIETVYRLVNQGLEMERMDLEIRESTSKDTLDVFVRLMEGERLLSVLIAARATQPFH